MRSSNNITISLPKDYIQKLESLKQEGETTGLCMKRLLIGLLDGVMPEAQSDEMDDLKRQFHEFMECNQSTLENLWDNLNDRLLQLENTNTASDGDHNLESGLKQLKLRIEGIESITASDSELIELEEAITKALFELNKRIEVLEQNTPKDVNPQLEDRLTKLEKEYKTLYDWNKDCVSGVLNARERLEVLEKGTPTPTHPTQQTEPPLPGLDTLTSSDTERLIVKADSGLTSSELSRLLDVSPSSVCRWKKKDGVDPSGEYRWNKHKRLWISDV